MFLAAAGLDVRHPMDLIDEHYYSSPDFFARQSHRYDTYSRTGTKVYVGEYAPDKASAMNTYQLTESDVITFHSYDPLPKLKEKVEVLKQYGRPLLCTEYMARPNGSTFDPVLGYAGAEGAVFPGLANEEVLTEFAATLQMFATVVRQVDAVRTDLVTLTDRIEPIVGAKQSGDDVLAQAPPSPLHVSCCRDRCRRATGSSPWSPMGGSLVGLKRRPRKASRPGRMKDERTCRQPHV